MTTTTSKYLPAGPLTVAVNVHTFEPPLAITNGTAQSRPFIVIEAPGVPVPLTEPSVSTKSWRSVIVTSSTSDWLTIVTRYENDPPGVWREPDPPGPFTPAPNLAKRLWFSRDVRAIAATDHLVLAAPVVVEADAAPNPGGLPRGGQTVVNFRNQHLSYAVTWFGLAIVLLGVWFSYNISKGRIGWI